MKIYVYRDDLVEGPFDDLIVQQALANGTMRPEQLCCRDGSGEWIAASSLFHTPPPLKPPPVGFLNRISAAKIPKITATRLPKFVKIGLIALGGFVGLIVFVCILGALFQPTQTAPSQQASGVRVETVLAADLQTMLNKKKQNVFENFHSLGGTADRIVVHAVNVTSWKNGQDTNRLEDIQGIVFRYTIYWTGPMTKDGYTKISQPFDFESQRPGQPEVIATNGITNTDLAQGAGEVLGMWLDYEAQKANSR